MLTFEQLVEGFRGLGVDEGDTLLVHSSYKSFGEVDGGPQTVIRALEAALGTDGEGTLIMPTFNFDFNKGAPWDVRTTPSKMGVLTELVRKDPRAKRVFHPFYSFAILGKHAEMLGSLRYKSAYERDSVFGKLARFGWEDHGDRIVVYEQHDVLPSHRANGRRGLSFPEAVHGRGDG
jgi:aminoglycoside 3-N-acetyltransferase